MRMARGALVFAVLVVALAACGDDGGEEGGGGEAAGATTGGDGAGGAGDESCDESGKPEMTGPIEGLQAGYAAGDPIDIGVPVDEDTARVIVGVYEVGTALYLGGTAEDTSGSTTQPLSLFAGVAGGATGTFYIAVELCSTEICTTPFIRNTYQRADRTLPMLDTGETYTQTREYVGSPAMTLACPSTIPIQSFEIQ